MVELRIAIPEQGKLLVCLCRTRPGRIFCCD